MVGAVRQYAHGVAVLEAHGARAEANALLAAALLAAALLTAALLVSSLLAAALVTAALAPPLAALAAKPTAVPPVATGSPVTPLPRHGRRAVAVLRRARGDQPLLV